MSIYASFVIGVCVGMIMIITALVITKEIYNKKYRGR